MSGDFCICNFFYADTPSVHTCPPYTLGVSGDFCIRSPELKFLYTLCIRIRVDARIRIFLYTLTSQYQNQSLSSRALSTNPLRCPDTCGRSYTLRVDGRIRFVWTQIFLYPDKKKFADTCGRGLKAIDTYASQGCVRSTCEAMGWLHGKGPFSSTKSHRRICQFAFARWYLNVCYDVRDNSAFTTRLQVNKAWRITTFFSEF